MGRVRQALIDEANGIKKSEEARKLRQQKKFGKKVQVEKIKERHAAKKSELEKVEIAKKKNKGIIDESIETLTGRGKKRGIDDVEIEIDKSTATGTSRSKMKRKGKDEKFGFGGKKRNIKSNTRDSTDDIYGEGKKGSKTGFFNAKKMKSSSGAKKNRPGKQRRSSKK